jgi:hypothetical protein
MAMLPAFLAEGCREIGRMANRLGWRRRLAAQDRERRQALAQLGHTAWQSKVDRIAFAEFRDRLQQLDARAGDLSATATRLDTERDELQTRRHTEVERFDALAAHHRAAAKERASAEPAPPASAARQQLVSDVDAQAAERQRRATELARIDAERKAALQPIDAKLEQLRQASAAASRDRADVGRDQQARFEELGAALYERRVHDPALAEGVQGVATVDAHRAATQGSIDGSLALTRGMPGGTMPKFWVTAVLVPVLLVAAAYGVRGWLDSGSAPAPATAAAPPRTAAAPPRVEKVNVAADESRKDQVVDAYLSAPQDAARRREGMQVLADDLARIGSSADRDSLPLVLKILARGEPELRAAAANAVGMIGATAAEMPALTSALNDPMPAVRARVVQVLGHLREPGAQLLVERVRSRTPEGQRPQSEGLVATVAPDAARLGVPLYPGATFLAFASDFDNGRIAFTSPDPLPKVLEFYTAAAPGHPPVDVREFSRLYFGGSANDPSGMDTLNAQASVWLQKAMASNTPQADIEAEYKRRMQLATSLPMVLYGEQTLFGEPAFIALDVAGSGGAARVARYLVVFQDLALGRTGVEVHVPPASLRK